VSILLKTRLLLLVKSLSTVDPMEAGYSTRLFIVILMISGLLVAACVNIAPEGTFGAGVAEVGVLDLLKVRVMFLAVSIPAE